MAEKVCCPGPIGGNNGNSAGGFREAVCVHTKKVYDSCRSKECLRDIRVYLTRDAKQNCSVFLLMLSGFSLIEVSTALISAFSTALNVKSAA